MLRTSAAAVLHAGGAVWCRAMWATGPSHSLVPQTGAVLGRVWQPHEAHVPYLLQFKIDFNLFGMGHLVLSRAKFR